MAEAGGSRGQDAGWTGVEVLRGIPGPGTWPVPARRPTAARRGPTPAASRPGSPAGSSWRCCSQPPQGPRAPRQRDLGRRTDARPRPRGAERATFVEKKYLAILDQPLESSGELRYVPPDRLEKRTLKPQPETAILERDLLTLERGNQKRALRLREYPEIAVFIESIRGTLAGDRKALERVYRLELHGGQERWTLVMFPSEAKLAAMVLRIDVTGTRDRVRGIEILQADGDRSVLSVERVAGAPPAPK
jgi:hypothetical protein